MSWIGRFGNRPHSLVTSAELFAMVESARNLGRKCEICQGAVAGVVHCKDCGWTRRLCDNHRPDVPDVAHLKKMHAAVCEPVKGTS